MNDLCPKGLSQILATLMRVIITGSVIVVCGHGQVMAADAATLPGHPARVLFLGDSITYAGGYVADIETYFILHAISPRPEFMNLGLPSETVSGLSEIGHAGGAFPRPVLQERLARVLAATKPDLVFACYGMNDGIYQPFDAQRFKAFTDGMTRLHAAVVAVGAPIIHLTPSSYDGARANNTAYIDTLNRYSAWLLGQRFKAGWTVIDIHGPMNAFIAEQRTKNPAFICMPDTVHPDAIGHWIMAKQVLQGLGAKDIAMDEDVAAMAAGSSFGTGGLRVLELVTTREDMMKDAWLTATHHLRPGMNTGLPMDQARVRYREIQADIEKALAGSDTTH